MINNDAVKRVYSQLEFFSDQWFRTFGNIRVRRAEAISLQNNLIEISQEIKSTYPLISTELFRLKDMICNAQFMINPVILGELIALLKVLCNISDNNDFWDMIHPKVIKVSKKLFDDGHYANASVDAFIEINYRVKNIYRIANPTTDRIPDGDDAMHVVFTPNNPIVEFDDITTDTGKNIQKGYMNMFSGAISALRNPKAHENISLGEAECKRNLVFASMLMYKIDDGLKKSGIQE